MEYPTHLAPGATQAPNAFPKDCWDALPGLTPQVKEDLRRIAAGLGAQPEEVEMVEDGQEGFEVMESYQLPSLKGVKEDRVVLPATRGVLARINKATTRLVRMTERGNPLSGSVRALNIDVSFPEGIEVPGEDGITTTKYVNKRVDFGIDLEFQVIKPEARQEEKYMGKNQSFLMPMKQFLAALGYDLENPPAINDAFLAELAGKTFRMDIRRRPKSVFDESTGKYVSLAEKRDDEGNIIDPGTYQNTYQNYQPA